MRLRSNPALVLSFTLSFTLSGCEYAAVVVDEAEAILSSVGEGDADAIPGDTGVDTGAEPEGGGVPDGEERPDGRPDGCRPGPRPRPPSGGSPTDSGLADSGLGDSGLADTGRRPPHGHGSVPDCGRPPKDSGLPDSGGVEPDEGDSADTGADPADTGDTADTSPAVDPSGETGEPDGTPVDTAAPPGDEIDPDTASGGAPSDADPVDTGAPIDTAGDGPGDSVADPGGGGAADHPERCHGFDDDLDGEVDEDAIDAPTWYVDADGDGFGDPATALTAWSQPAGYVADATDCDDTTADVHPGATERCDGEDGDCNGLVDDDAVDALDWYPDADGDGYGDPAGIAWSCEAPAGYGPTGDDCDDTDATIAPNGVERCNGADDDCDGVVDEDAVDADAGFLDLDGDGYGSTPVDPICAGLDAGVVAEGGDCDDDLAWVHPDADELCDGVDSNCDGDLDAGALDAPTWYADRDADGYGDATLSVSQCEAPVGWVAEAGDCDDADVDRAPDVTEVCNGVDDDCSGLVDDGAGACSDDTGGDADPGDPVDSGSGGGGTPPVDTGVDDDPGGGTPPDPCAEETWYADLDGDGWGDDADMVEGCQPDATWVAQGGDCDDTDATIAPNGAERCNGVDDDCDGDVDEGAEYVLVWYADRDGDGIGTGSSFERACSPSAGFVAEAGDCDDSDPAVFPGAVEYCDGIDNDCNEGVDEVSAVDAPAWFVDRDGDGYAGTTTRLACSAPADGHTTAEDCDDDNADAYPGALEVCNDVDDDCNGVVDDATAIGASYHYVDADGDGYGDPFTGMWSCSSIEGYVTDGTDCDDADAGSAPGHRERCDGKDNNCDGEVDEAGSRGETRWYLDADGDGAGDIAANTMACSMPAGYSVSYDDCDDADPTAYPGNVEVCGDGVDNDCDGLSDRCGPWGERDVDAGDAWMFGESADDDAGRSVAFLGDVDGDGFDDWAVGVPKSDRSASDGGALFVYGGDSAGEQEAADAVARIYGSATNDYLGWAVADAGDVDGDGLGDVLVGAYNASLTGASAGAVYLFAGGLSGDVGPAAARLTLLGGAAVDFAGYAIDAGGDLTGDGTSDVLVGAPYEDTRGDRAGAAYVVSGALTGTMSLTSATAVRYGELALDRAGTALAIPGDLDGDGFADLMVGAWGDSTVGARAGAVYVEYGPITGAAALSTADAKWLGARTGNRAGLAVSAAGDVDGDGLDDALVGAPYAQAAYLVGASTGTASLSTATAIFQQETAGSRLGTSVSGGGDVDGDGFADVVLGAPLSSGSHASAGTAFVVRGPVSGTVLLADSDGLLRGVSSQDFAGTAVSDRGDVDGDGFAAVLGGAVGDDDGGAAAGSAWLFFGTTP
jgi:hypothetical protein